MTDGVDQFLAHVCKLCLLGSAFLVTYRAGFLNLAISAQLITGAIVGASLASSTNNLAIAIVAAYASMTLVGLIPAALKVYAEVDEVLSSLMLLFMSLPLAQFILGTMSHDTSTSTAAVPDLQHWLVGDLQWTSWVHLLSVVMLVVSAQILAHWPVGYYARTIRWSPRLYAESVHFGVLVRLHLLASACLLAVIVADTFITWGKYTPPALVQDGFDGVAVALIALLRFALIPLAAAIVAGGSLFFIVISIDQGWPESVGLFMNGILLIVAAVSIGKVRKAR